MTITCALCDAILSNLCCIAVDLRVNCKVFKVLKALLDHQGDELVVVLPKGHLLSILLKLCLYWGRGRLRISWRCWLEQ